MWMLSLQLLQQLQQSLLLRFRPCVGHFSMFIVAAFVAYTQRMAVVTLGVSTDQLLMPCLVGRAVAGDVVVVASESEAVGVAADEGGHREWTVAARGRAVNHYKINSSHNQSSFRSAGFQARE